MIIWLDAQLSPVIADWLNSEYQVTAIAVRDLGLRESTDHKIFKEARNADAVVMTKDSDFVKLLDEFGPPHRIVWLTFGNTSNKNLKRNLTDTFVRALALLDDGESLVEISAT